MRQIKLLSLTQLAKMCHIRYKTRTVFLTLSFVFIIAFATFMIVFQPRYVPMSILCLFVTPTRLRKSSCPEKVNMDRTLPATDQSQPRYVYHQPIGGRIGNQLFQAAATIGIAHSLNYKPYIDLSNPLTEYFELTPTKEIQLTNMFTLTEDDCRHEDWKCRNDIYNHNLTIQGWLQSWKYFEHIAPLIRKVFTPKPYFQIKAKEFIDSVKPLNVTLIGLHVRRTDTTTLSDVIGGYTNPGPTYIQKAMALFRKKFKNAFFVVVSDDIPWCEAVLIPQDLVFSKFDNPIIDLTLLSMCDHVIMTIGTFGWWGAWLAGGEVIYLSDWPRPGSWLDLYGVVKEEFFKPGWIGLGN